MIDYDAKSWLSVAFAVRGTVLPRIALRLVLVTAIGAAAAFLYKATGLKIPPIAHTLVGVALGLLLVFRTNASYDRYWEGRKLLGSMVNRTRDVSRQIAAFTKDADEPETRAHILAVRRYLVLFYRLAMQGLRSEKNLDAVAALLGPGDREALEPVNARAYVALTMLTRHVKALHAAGKLTDANVITIDGGITTLIDSLGGCERIVKTPVPFAYAQHIKVFVILFTLTIPFAVVDMLKWGTPIASAILGFALFGIDEIGVEIEDPFGYDENDLPVERIGDVIDASTKDIVGG